MYKINSYIYQTIQTPKTSNMIISQKYINIHTHTKDYLANEISIQNIFPGDILSTNHNCWYSVGIHPWFINLETVNNELKILEHRLNNNILAVGEIGLDKLYPGFELQKEVFTQQINIANSLKKPIIIHCVKSFSEILSILKKNNIEVPVIFHGFNSSSEIAKEIIAQNYYISLGKILFQNQGKVLNYIKEIPLKNIFFETDNSEYNIEQIYRKASQIFEIDESKIIKEIFIKFVDIFNFNSQLIK